MVKVYNVPTRQTNMKCPNCQNREFDVYEARGFTSKESPIKECECGHVWRLIPLAGSNKRIDTIKHGEFIDISPARIRS
jgi:uncharacterized Zn finger protein